MRKSISFHVKDKPAFREKLLHWCEQYSRCALLDSGNHEKSSAELIVAAGSLDDIAPGQNYFEKIKTFHSTVNDWLFGYLSYDLKNEAENLSSNNFDGVHFPDACFFRPELVFKLSETQLQVEYVPAYTSEERVKNVFEEIVNIAVEKFNAPVKMRLKERMPRTQYLEQVYKIKEHIQKGDIYELNYCIEFYAQHTVIDPAKVFLKLTEATRAPFSAFFRSEDKYALCASPERFLKKSKNKITSQPIKGTARRGKTRSEDEKIKREFSVSEKDRIENVMIVDLVRNDLSKTCTNVSVEELFGVYAFHQWHHMISTVSGEMRKGIHFTEVIKNAFPMGSMTGAPKVRAMQLIEEYEKTKRGLYSGAIGYITPDGDFDFNVFIRGIVYNKTTQYLSFQVGSAITAGSDPEMEYRECLLKAKGMLSALNATEDVLIRSQEPLKFNTHV